MLFIKCTFLTFRARRKAECHMANGVNAWILACRLKSGCRTRFSNRNRKPSCEFIVASDWVKGIKWVLGKILWKKISEMYNFGFELFHCNIEGQLMNSDYFYSVIILKRLIWQNYNPRSNQQIKFIILKVTQPGHRLINDHFKLKNRYPSPTMINYSFPLEFIQNEGEKRGKWFDF